MRESRALPRPARIICSRNPVCCVEGLAMKPLIALLALAAAACSVAPSPDSSNARDPGVRGGPAGAGAPIAGLSATELAFFKAGKEEFSKTEDVADGLGPTM